MKPVIFSACDEGFYRGFGPALRNSAEANGFKCILVSSGEWAKTHESRVRHSVFRYMLLPDILIDHSAVLMLDTDSIIRRPFEVGDCDIGLIVRGKPDPKHQVNGSAVYFTGRARPGALLLRQKLCGKTEWYDDQRALRELYLSQQYRCQIFDERLVSWNLKDAPIWTGKGPVKLSDEWYAEMKRWDADAMRPMRGKD